MQDDKELMVGTILVEITENWYCYMMTASITKISQGQVYRMNLSL